MDFGIAKMTHVDAADRDRPDDGHGALHVARAGARPGGRPPHRHLLARRDALRVADRRHAVRRQHALRDHDEAPVARCRSGRRRSAIEVPRGRRGRADAQPREERRRSVRDRARDAQDPRGGAARTATSASSRPSGSSREGPRPALAPRERGRRRAARGADRRSASRPRTTSPTSSSPAPPRRCGRRAAGGASCRSSRSAAPLIGGGVAGALVMMRAPRRLPADRPDRGRHADRRPAVRRAARRDRRRRSRPTEVAAIYRMQLAALRLHVGAAEAGARRPGSGDRAGRDARRRRCASSATALADRAEGLRVVAVGRRCSARSGSTGCSWCRRSRAARRGDPPRHRAGGVRPAARTARTPDGEKRAQELCALTESFVAAACPSERVGVCFAAGRIDNSVEASRIIAGGGSMSRTVIAAVVAVVIAGAHGDRVLRHVDELRRARPQGRRRPARARVPGRPAAQPARRASTSRTRPSASPPTASSSPRSRPTARPSGNQARIGFQKFIADEKQGDVKPDIIALVDAKGNLLAMNEVPTRRAKQWRRTTKGDVDHPRRSTSCSARSVIISDIWNYGDKHDEDRRRADHRSRCADPPKDPEGVVDHRRDRRRVRADREERAAGQARCSAPRSRTTTASASSRRASRAAPAARRTPRRRKQLSRAARERQGQREGATRQKITIDGDDYFAAAVKMPRKSTKDAARPPEYPPITAGAIVLAPIVASPATPRARSSCSSCCSAAARSRSRCSASTSRTAGSSRRSIRSSSASPTSSTATSIARSARSAPSSTGSRTASTSCSRACSAAPSPARRSSTRRATRSSRAASSSRRGEGEQPPAVDPDLAALAQESRARLLQARLHRVRRGAQARTGNARRGLVRELHREAQGQRGQAEGAVPVPRGALPRRDQGRQGLAQAGPDLRVSAGPSA